MEVLGSAGAEVLGAAVAAAATVSGPHAVTLFAMTAEWAKRMWKL
jgi:hypothetical protein